MAFVDGYCTVCGRPNTRIGWLDKHHAIVECEGRPPRVADVVAIVPNSANYAISLAHEALVVSNGEIFDRWSVHANGCVR